MADDRAPNSPSISLPPPVERERRASDGGSGGLSEVKLPPPLSRIQTTPELQSANDDSHRRMQSLWTTRHTGDAASPAQLQQVRDAVAELAGSPQQQKQAAFRLAALLRDEHTARGLAELPHGPTTLIHVACAATGNTLTYALQALRSYVSHDFGMRAAVESSQLLQHLFRILTAADIKTAAVTKQAIDLLTMLVDASTPELPHKGFLLVDEAARALSGSLSAPGSSPSSPPASPRGGGGGGEFPYAVVVALMQRHPDVDVKTNALRMLCRLAINCVGTPLQAARLAQFRSSNVAQAAEQLHVEYEPFQDQLSLLQRVTTGSGDAVTSNIKVLLDKEHAQMKARLKDLLDLSSQLQAEKKVLESKLKAYEKREPLVRMLWREVMILRTNLDQAIVQGFRANLDAPTHRISRDSSQYLTNIPMVDLSRMQYRQAMEQHQMNPPLSSVDEYIPPPPPLPSSSSPSPSHAHGITGGHTYPSDVPPPPPDYGFSSDGAPPAPPMDIPDAPDAPGMTRRVSIKPSKPAVKPGTKMKPLHWNRLLLGEVREAREHHVWKLVEEVKLDAADFESNFAQKAVKKAPKKSDAATDDSGLVQVIKDRKRHNALAIALSKLPEPDVITKAIQTLDDKLLDEEKVETLYKCMPTEEEVKLVGECKLPNSRLMEPELFIRAVSIIPQVANRVACWYFRNKYPEALKDLFGALAAVRSACSTVRNSARLRQSLGLVLTVGNYLNGGTARGQADGFDLTVLDRLETVKDVQTGEMSLLDYIAQLALRLFGDDFADKFKEELQPCRVGAAYSLRALSGEAIELNTHVTTYKRVASMISVATDDSLDPFNKKMALFHRFAESEGRKLMDELRKAQQDFVDLVLFLQPRLEPSEAERQQNSDLFAALYKFSTAFDNAVKRYKARLLAEEQEQQSRLVASNLQATLKASRMNVDQTTHRASVWETD